MTNGSQDHIHPNDMQTATQPAIQHDLFTEFGGNAARLCYQRKNRDGSSNSEQRKTPLENHQLDVKPDHAHIAAEFASKEPHQFPRGAYSTVDTLLSYALARNEYVTILLNTAVLHLNFKANGDNESREVEYPTLCQTSTPSHRGRVKAKTAVILCGGTIGTAIIAQKSGLDSDCPKIGKGIMDH